MEVSAGGGGGVGRERWRWQLNVFMGPIVTSPNFMGSNSKNAKTFV